MFDSVPIRINISLVCVEQKKGKEVKQNWEFRAIKTVAILPCFAADI